MADMSTNKFWDTVWSRPYGRYNRHHQEIWNKVQPYLKGEVLDIGCGVAMLYKDKNIDLTGVDFSAEALEQAKKNYPKGNYFLADARSTGLPDGKFDTVMMLGLLDYFDDWTQMINEAKRVCKKDGRIMATLLNGFRGHDWTKYSHVVGNWYLYEIQ